MNRLKLGLALVSLVFASCGTDGRGEKQLFFDGKAAIEQGYYKDGQRVLEQYLTSYPRGKYASRASIYLAKSHLGRADLVRAEFQFNAVIDDFPGTPEARKAHYKLAMVALARGRVNEARQGFQKVAGDIHGPLQPEAEVMVRYLVGVN